MSKVTELTECGLRYVVSVVPRVLQGIEQDLAEIYGSHLVMYPSAVNIAPLTQAFLA